MFSYDEIRMLNELEMIVYNYIIQNKEKVIYMKIRELAEGAHVSTTTVLRFCKKVGCEGFSEFKIRFKIYLQENKEKQPDWDMSLVIDFFHRAEMESYQQSLQKAVKILADVNTIIFIGTGNSNIMGRYGARYFNNVGCFSLSIDDPFMPVYQGKSGTMAVVALSVSGETKETIQQANQLKYRGCPVISITNHANTTLAQMSDCNISYYIPSSHRNTYLDITSQIPVVFLLETLGRRLAGVRSENKL